MPGKVIVKLTGGLLEGEFVENDYGGSFYSFKGIPYAEPPLDDLRFKPPLPPKPWEGVRSAKEHGPISYQYDVFKKTTSGSEDCLYLNVYTPQIKPKKPLPVMVWIHGGGFFWGSGDDDFYGPEFLVKHDVILVTFNYRLGVLGFLCLDSPDVPGNAGMKDQVEALKWVKGNISIFGGDPENITIFGESAGAGSVNLHLLSPMSKGLFKRAIVQSGSATAYWCQAFEPLEKAKALAKSLGLYTEDTKEIYKFLKEQPMESLINLKLPITYAETTSINLEFPPTVEKDFGQEIFLPENSFYLLKKGIHPEVDVMAGYVEDEGLVYLHSYKELDRNIENINSFREALVPRLLMRTIPIREQLEIGRKMKKFYFDDKLVSRKDWQQVQRYLMFNMFSYNMVHLVKSIANTNKSYFYKFTCKSNRNFFKKLFTDNDITKDIDVVCHCDDLAYLFPIKFMNQIIDIKSREFILIEKVTKLFTDFAKYGNPTPDDTLGVNWKPYCLQQQPYMDIGENLVMKMRPDEEEIQFWENIFKDYNPYMSV